MACWCYKHFAPLERRHFLKLHFKLEPTIDGESFGVRWQSEGATALWIIGGSKLAADLRG